MLAAPNRVNCLLVHRSSLSLYKVAEALEGRGVGVTLSVEASEALASLVPAIGFDEVVQVGQGLHVVRKKKNCGAGIYIF